MLYVSEGNGNDDRAGMFGHIDETAPPLPRTDPTLGVGHVPGRQEVVGLMATGGDVVVDVDRVLPDGQAFDGHPEGHDAAFRVTRVVAVEVAVLPRPCGAGPLVEVDGGRRRPRHRRGDGQEQARDDDGGPGGRTGSCHAASVRPDRVRLSSSEGVLPVAPDRHQRPPDVSAGSVAARIGGVPTHRVDGDGGGRSAQGRAPMAGRTVRIQAAAVRPQAAIATANATTPVTCERVCARLAPWPSSHHGSRAVRILPSMGRLLYRWGRRPDRDGRRVLAPA